MILLKKLLFAPLFLLAFVLLVSQLNTLLSSYDLIFSLSMDTLIQLITITGLIVLSSFLFTLFATFSADWRFVLPVAAISSVASLIFIPMPLGLIFVVSIFVSLLLTNISLDSNLNSYLTFKPEALLGPSIRHLSGLLILSFCLIYFLSSNKLIAQNGFQLPDSLIDTALKMTPLPQSDNQAQTNMPQLSNDQLTLLKENPDLLKQSGLDPKILDSLTNPQKILQAPADLMRDTIKQTVKDQIQGFIKPYQGFIPAILTVLLFLSLQSLTSLVNLLIYPLLWFLFFIFEKTGFVRFEIEQRPVKKLVV